MQNKVALEEHYEMFVNDAVRSQLAESEGSPRDSVELSRRTPMTDEEHRKVARTRSNGMASRRRR